MTVFPRVNPIRIRSVAAAVAVAWALAGASPAAVADEPKVGAPYPQIKIDVHKPDQVFAGTTAFIDTTSPSFPRIVEIDMEGNLVWDYLIKPEIFGGAAVPESAVKGMDLEWIPRSDSFLFVVVGAGVFEVNRQKQIVWKYLTKHVSHDADRLPNGNTIMVWGWDDKNEPQVTEVDPNGRIVWQWFAKDHLKRDPPTRKGRESAPSYTHANAVTRMRNGHTLISLRNFNVAVQVDGSGEIVWRLPRVNLVHDPQILPNRNIVLSTRNPHRTVEYTRQQEEVWSFERDDVATVRGNQRLRNGSTLLTERTKLLEVTWNKEVVWQATLKGVSWQHLDAGVRGGSAGFAGEKDQWFYKAVRIPAKQ